MLGEEMGEDVEQVEEKGGHGLGGYLQATKYGSV